MKKLVFTLLFGIILLGFMNTEVHAEETVLKTESELYVKQSLQLNIFFNGEAVNPKDVSWKVTSGSDCAKIGKDGIVTGKKKGKAVITGTYKSGTVEFTFTVKKAPKAKAKSYKINGLTVKMPKGLVKSKADSTDAQTVFKHIKDETTIRISVLDISESDDITDADIINYYSSYFKTTVEEGVGIVNGFNVTKTEIVSEKELKKGYNIMAMETIATERPVYLTNIVSIKGNKLLYITISSNSQDRSKDLADGIVSKNKLGK